jgi:hypothetical protein
VTDICEIGPSYTLRAYREARENQGIEAPVIVRHSILYQLKIHCIGPTGFPSCDDLGSKLAIGIVFDHDIRWFDIPVCGNELSDAARVNNLLKSWSTQDSGELVHGNGESLKLAVVFIR